MPPVLPLPLSSTNSEHSRCNDRILTRDDVSCLRKLAPTAGAHSALSLQPLARLIHGSPYSLVRRNVLLLLVRISSLHAMEEAHDWDQVAAACEVPPPRPTRLFSYP